MGRCEPRQSPFPLREIFLAAVELEGSCGTASAADREEVDDSSTRKPRCAGERLRQFDPARPKTRFLE